MGGVQGETGKMVFFDYQPGSMWDYIVEAYAGPHDYLNQFFAYDRFGNINISRGPVLRAIGGVMNYLDVFVATPLVVSSVIPAYVTPQLSQAYRQSK